MKKTWLAFLALALATFWLIIIVPFAFPQNPATTKPAENAPVVFEGKTLFVIQNRLGPRSAKKRAQDIREKIEHFAQDFSISVDNLTAVSEDEEGIKLTVLAVEEDIIMRISDADAVLARKTRAELAYEYLQAIKAAVTQYRQERSLRHLVLAGFYTIISTIFFITTLLILNNIFPVIYTKLDNWRSTYIPAIRIQSFEILTANQITNLLLSLTQIIRWFIVLGILAIYIPAVLSFFPWTKRLANTLFEYLIQAFATAWSGFLGYIPNLLIILVVIFLTYCILRFLQPIFNALEQETFSLPGFYPEWAQPSFKILSVLIVALAAVIAVPYFPGFDSPAFRGISVFLGILFSLGSSSAIANIFAGTILIYTRGFRQGDLVKIGDTVGRVIETTLLVTRIVTFKNIIVSIPNSQILTSNIENYDLSRRELNKTLILPTKVYLGYEVPWQKAHKALCEAAKRTEKVLESPAPFVLQSELNEVYVTYELNVHVEPDLDILEIYSQLHQNIRDTCSEAEIRIFAPSYEADPTTYPFNSESVESSQENSKML
uniref:MscS Mechanosensitive ion channel n=2 Tax=Gloeothece TaxID=28070 RepID=E0UHM5_GLOV7|nr:MscS Mechanosensitive ion channel [Gloeothece verrucosa PCC 7822]